jgi:hypothetical protein
MRQEWTDCLRAVLFIGIDSPDFISTEEQEGNYLDAGAYLIR